MTNNKFEREDWDRLDPLVEQPLMDDCVHWATNKQIDFFVALKFIGIEPRAYDQAHALALLKAARTIHFHLCNLDRRNYAATQHTTIRDFANAFSYSDGEGNTRHHD